MSDDAPDNGLRLPAELADELPRRIAHELRTPLGLVVTALRELGHDGDDPILALGHRGARQLERLAHRLSVLGRLMRAEPSSSALVDVNTVASRAVDDIATTRPRRRVEVIRKLDADDPWVHGHGDDLRAALAELVDNAVRFARRSIEVSTRRIDGRIAIEVRDDGPGPSRVATGAPSASGGLGIGLQLARALVAAHAGRLELRDGSDGGARATIILDCVTP